MKLRLTCFHYTVKNKVCTRHKPLAYNYNSVCDSHLQYEQFCDTNESYQNYCWQVLLALVSLSNSNTVHQSMRQAIEQRNNTVLTGFHVLTVSLFVSVSGMVLPGAACS